MARSMHLAWPPIVIQSLTNSVMSPPALRVPSALYGNGDRNLAGVESVSFDKVLIDGATSAATIKESCHGQGR